MIIQWTTYRMPTACVMGLAAALFCATAVGVGAQRLAPGTWELKMAGSMFTLHANEARVSDVVSSIDAMIPADVHIGILPDGTVSGTFDNLALDDLLDRMAVDYVLFYETGDTPDHAVLQRAVIGSGEFSGVSVVRLQKIRALIQDLRHDEISFNAIRGLSGLRSIGRDSIPALEQALQYGDYQSRQFAAEALYRMLESPHHRYSPTTRFNDILIEGMKSDGYGISIANARRGYDYFTDRPEEIERVEPTLAQALNGPDPQQRFLSALVLAQAGKTKYMSRLAEILAPHLADNDLSSDGALAANALFDLGPAAWPFLVPLTDSEDRQQAVLAQSIIDQGLAPDAELDLGLLTQGGFANRNPVRERVRPVMNGWTPDQFPSHAWH